MTDEVTAREDFQAWLHSWQRRDRGKLTHRVAWGTTPKLGKGGHGPPLPFKVAKSAVEAMNRQYGAGTHWVEKVSDES